MVWSKEVLTAKKEGFTWFVLAFFLKKKNKIVPCLFYSCPSSPLHFFNLQEKRRHLVSDSVIQETVL